MTLNVAHSGSSTPRALVTEEPARIRATIARAPLFAALPISAIEDLSQRVAVRKVTAHHTVVTQDEPGETMFLIMSGRIKVVIFGENGREVTLSILRPGDAFGEMSLFDGEARSANCVALEACTLLALSREDLLRHLANHPRTTLNLLGEMARRLRRADESIAQLALCDVNERLVHQLVSLAREEGVDAPEGVLVRRRPTQQELANMIGSCRETISRAFNQLARDGLIIPRGRAMVVTQELIERSGRRRAAN
ncbi:Crp/Fnr family transcriptional regulator [Haliangium ochraceum]|uniref:Transcriptional regulator, Crp/Fnr family n=1 Tax=Haliangium ochraceum (strain DSM 14365 / JCM 11303 / SMP-2) TaxID=502025 RepID=D0LJM6_HALO1|nr:Crp/Fnr family transcriptional regulator [Haliangium ochraceum]ACY16600.1 transcriptional regulator, Crp/Fnr family [Haliangium ochraceum DSM 14365]